MSDKKEFWGLVDGGSTIMFKTGRYIGGQLIGKSFGLLEQFTSPKLGEPNAPKVPLIERDIAVDLIEKGRARGDKACIKRGEHILRQVLHPTVTGSFKHGLPAPQVVENIAATAYELGMQPHEFDTDPTTHQRLATAMGELSIYDGHRFSS